MYDVMMSCMSSFRRQSQLLADNAMVTCERMSGANTLTYRTLTPITEDHRQSFELLHFFCFDIRNEHVT